MYNMLENCDFDIDFQQNAERTNLEIKKTGLKKIALPKLRLLYGGEEYYDTLFKVIDKAKYQVWLVNYTLEDSQVGNIYLKKLINAVERGVDCYMFIDNLVSKPNQQLLDELISKGGTVLYRNPKQYIWQMPARSYFQRDHEKLCLSDNNIVLGSSNIAEEYGGIKYGNNFFTDLNIHMKNCCIKDTMLFFEIMKKNLSIPDRWKISQSTDFTAAYLKRFPDSPFSTQNIKLLRSFYPLVDEIQYFMLKRVREAKKSIRIIAPYYFPIKDFDDELFKALERGVDVELITSMRRDVPAYAYFHNSVLFNKYIEKGVKVREFTANHLHAKALNVDDEIVNLGSFNLDHWSWYNNNEVNVEICNNKELITQFNTVYGKLKEHSKAVQYKANYDDPFDRFVNSFWIWFLSACTSLVCYRNYYKRYHKKYDKEVKNKPYNREYWLEKYNRRIYKWLKGEDS